MSSKLRRIVVLSAVVIGANAALSLFNTAAAAETRQGSCGQTCNCSTNFNCNFNGSNCVCNIAFDCSTLAGCYHGYQS